jgi:hypothetical protein
MRRFGQRAGTAGFFGVCPLGRKHVWLERYVYFTHMPHICMLIDVLSYSGSSFGVSTCVNYAGYVPKELLILATSPHRRQI